MNHKNRGIALLYWHVLLLLIRMREGYGSRFVCVCLSVCLSVTALAATYLVCMFKLRHRRVPCRLLKVCIAWI